MESFQRDPGNVLAICITRGLICCASPSVAASLCQARARHGACAVIRADGAAAVCSRSVRRAHVRSTLQGSQSRCACRGAVCREINVAPIRVCTFCIGVAYCVSAYRVCAPACHAAYVSAGDVICRCPWCAQCSDYVAMSFWPPWATPALVHMNVLTSVYPSINATPLAPTLLAYTHVLWPSSARPVARGD